MMGGAAKNAYKLDEILGEFHSAMDGAIAIYRLGTGPDDDDSLLGCLTPRPGKNDTIRVIHFGQLDRTDRLKQGMVCDSPGLSDTGGAEVYAAVAGT